MVLSLWIEKSDVKEVGFLTENDPCIFSCPDMISTFTVNPSEGKAYCNKRDSFWPRLAWIPSFIEVMAGAIWDKVEYSD